jgi:hypothetical protein
MQIEIGEVRIRAGSADFADLSLPLGPRRASSSRARSTSTGWRGSKGVSTSSPPTGGRMSP